jgi:hypothetical protein
MMYLLTAVGLTPDGSSTVQYTFTINTQNKHSETRCKERNIHYNKNTKFTKLNRIIQNIQPYTYGDQKVSLHLTITVQKTSKNMVF